VRRVSSGEWQPVSTKQAQRDAKKLAARGLGGNAQELLDLVRELTPWYRKWRRGRAEAIQFDGKNPAYSQVGFRKCKKNLTCVGESYTFMILARCLSRAYLQLFIPVTLSEILTIRRFKAIPQAINSKHKHLIVHLIMYLARNVLICARNSAVGFRIRIGRSLSVSLTHSKRRHHV